MLKGYQQKYLVNLVEEEDDKYSRNHNISFVRIPEHFTISKPYHKYIYVVRIDNKNALRMGYGLPVSFNYNSDHVIPGNGSMCREISFLRKGQWFWWNNWREMIGSTNTYLFVGDHNTNQYDFIFNLWLDGSDIRITNIDGNIYMYNSELTEVHIFLDTNRTKKLKITKTGEGKNYVLTDIQFIGDSIDSPCIIQYLDWFQINGVSCKTEFYRFSEPGYIRKYYIDDNVIIPEDDLFDFADTKPNNPFFFTGIGSYMDGKSDGSINWGVTPLMSFSTPLVKYGNLYIGVGHLKIHSDADTYPYLPGSNIENFRSYISQYMNDTYGDRYIQHFGTSIRDGLCQGYLYLIYFYILTYDYPFEGRFSSIKHWKSMHISDGYLPLSDKSIKDTDYDRDYKFSLYFPMGLELDGKNLIVSCGYGDYYSAFLEYDVDTVVAGCKHDVSHLDFNSYQYHLDILAPVM